MRRVLDATAATTRVVFYDCGPTPELFFDFNAVLQSGGFRQLREVCFEFSSLEDIRGVQSMLALLGGDCPTLTFVGAARVGVGEPSRVRRRFVSVMEHLGRAAARSMQSISFSQRPAVEMRVLLHSLTSLTTLRHLQSLCLTDGYTANEDVHYVNSADRRAYQPLPPLTAVAFSHLTSLVIHHVRGGADMLPQLHELLLLRRLDILGAEDVPSSMPPGLTSLALGMLSARGFGRALELDSLDYLYVDSTDMHETPARPSRPWALLRIDDTDTQLFHLTCETLHTAANRGLLPSDLCLWKVGWGFDRTAVPLCRTVVL